MIACVLAAGFVAYNVWQMPPEQALIDGSDGTIDPVPRMARARRGDHPRDGDRDLLSLHLPGSLHARMVGRHLRFVRLLQTDRVVRKFGLHRDASVFVEMVELADDAASGRLLAAFSQGRKSRHGMGRRQSADLVGRADRNDFHRDLHHREADGDARLHAIRLSCLHFDVGLDRPHAVSLSLHARGLSRVPRAGGGSRRMLVRRRGAMVRASRHPRDDRTGAPSRPRRRMGLGRTGASPGSLGRIDRSMARVQRKIRHRDFRPRGRRPLHLFLPGLDRDAD